MPALVVATLGAPRPLLFHQPGIGSVVASRRRFAVPFRPAQPAGGLPPPHGDALYGADTMR
jgi:hypothetical protein